MDKITLSLDEFLSLSPDEIKRMAEENAKLDSNGRYSDETWTCKLCNTINSCEYSYCSNCGEQNTYRV